MRTSINLAIWLLYAAAHGATVVTHTIREDGSGSYTNLAQWEAAQQRDLVSADEIEMAVIEGTWNNPDTTALTISGWTTDATRYIVITNSTSKHDGKRYGSASSAYRLQTTNAAVCTINEEFVRIYGLQISVQSATSLLPIFGGDTLDYDNSIIVGDCIISGTSAGASGAGVGFYFSDYDVNLTVYNTLCHGLTNTAGTDGRFVRAIGRTHLYNCTGVANAYDYWFTDGTAVATNCVSQDSVNDGFHASFTGDYNCSDISSDAPGSNSVNGYEIPFVSETAGSQDFHLSISATSVIGAGIDSPTSLYSTDIDGQTRSDWDIGADEYIAASSGQVIVVVTQ